MRIIQIQFLLQRKTRVSISKINLAFVVREINVAYSYSSIKPINSMSKNEDSLDVKVSDSMVRTVI
jgi:hypothetical protein